MMHPILDLPMGVNDADAATIREYMKTLLRKVIREGESFSGKRPFGNSGWKSEMFFPLVKAGVIDGALDEDGYLNGCNNAAATVILLNAVKDL
jgi:hypothetical protein